MKFHVCPDIKCCGSIIKHLFNKKKKNKPLSVIVTDNENHTSCHIPVKPVGKQHIVYILEFER